MSLPLECPRSPSSGHRGLVALRQLVYDGAVFIERAYTERESLSDRDLERLRAALADQAQQYEYAIRNYPPDRMEKHGQPFLSRLLEKVAHVDALITRRKNVD